MIENLIVAAGTVLGVFTFLVFAGFNAERRRY